MSVIRILKSAYLHQIARETMLLLCNDLLEKKTRKVKTDEILTARAHYL